MRETILLVSALAACTAVRPATPCDTDATCAAATGNAASVCAPAGWCTVPDDSCASHQRYGEASGGLSGQCTSDAAFGCVTDLRAGAAVTCANRSDGTAWCWGGGHATPASIKTPSDAAIASVAIGGHELCARTATGQLACAPTLAQALVATTAVPGIVARDVAIGDAHTCAVTASQSVTCWGANDSGQLGDGTTAANAQPVATSNLSGARQLAASAATTTAVTEQNTVWGWGSNDEEEIGITCTACAKYPTPAATPNMDAHAARAIAMGDHFTCILGKTSQVVCWGAGTHGQLAVQLSPIDFGSTEEPQRIALPGPALDLAAGGNHACAITSDHGVWCWGDDRFQAAQILDADRHELRAVRVAAGKAHSCALTPDGDVMCWGSNASGELGTGATGAATTTAITTALRCD